MRRKIYALRAGILLFLVAVLVIGPTRVEDKAADSRTAGLGLDKIPFFQIYHLRRDLAQNKGEILVLTKGDTVSGNAFELLVFDYLVHEMDMSTAGACGIMANIYKECRFAPNLLQRSCQDEVGLNSRDYTAAVDQGTYTEFHEDGAGYGLCQWTYCDRKEKLLAYAREREVSISDYRMQLDFVRMEILNNKKVNELWEELLGAEGTEEGAYHAGWSFCYYYEKPKNYKKGAVERGNLAADAFWKVYGDFEPNRDRIESEAEQMAVMAP